MPQHDQKPEQASRSRSVASSLAPIQRHKLDGEDFTDEHAQALSGDGAVKVDKPHYEVQSVTVDDATEDAGKKMTAVISPYHGKGSSPKTGEQKNIFANLPTIGTEKKESGVKVPGDEIYIKGHLLNDNLGGPGEGKNLFPITSTANAQHKEKIEKTAKKMVNEQGRFALYTVKATKGTTEEIEDHDKELHYINGTFDCRLTPIIHKDTGGFELDGGAARTAKIYSRYSGTQDAKDPDQAGALDPSGDVKKHTLDNFNPKLVEWAPSKARKGLVAEWNNTAIWDFQFAQLLAGEEISEDKFVKWLIKSVKGVGKKKAEALVLEAALAKDGNLTEMSSNAKAGYNKLQAWLLEKHKAAQAAFQQAKLEEQDQETASQDEDDASAAAVGEVIDGTKKASQELKKDGSDLGEAIVTIKSKSSSDVEEESGDMIMMSDKSLVKESESQKKEDPYMEEYMQSAFGKSMYARLLKTKGSRVMVASIEQVENVMAGDVTVIQGHKVKVIQIYTYGGTSTLEVMPL